MVAYNKVKPYKDKTLKGKTAVYYKIDGVRALKNPNYGFEGEPKYISRNNKKLHNLDHLEFNDAEIFLKDWETSVGLVRTVKGKPVDKNCVYTLEPIDDRLYVKEYVDISKKDIEIELHTALEKGYEGIVLYNNNNMYKVKPKETFDVYVTGYVSGKGKHTGVMGALDTDMGRVGTGFTDKDRVLFKEYHDKGLLNTVMIEVEVMSLTKNNKFRHPRFIRHRFDKE
ncbi:DNA ligase [Vibrio phage VpJYP1]|nr:DNA ligase [Vibrio phage VpJYP1]